MADHLDELIALVESVGGKVRLHGVEVSARELRTFAWAGFVERFSDQVMKAAAHRMCVPAEPAWSYYP